MKTSKLVPLIVLSSILVLGILLVCWPSRKPQVTRIGYLAIGNSLPLFVAADGGFFAREAVDASLVRFETSNELLEALYAGRIDAQVSASTAVVLSMETRSPGGTRIFSANIQTATSAPDCILVRSDSGITTISALADRRIGTFPGSTFLMLVRVILKRAGDPLNVVVEQIPPTAQIDALASGAVDAIYTLEPFCTLAQQRGGISILVRGAAEHYVMDPLPGGVASFAPAFIAKDPETAKRVSRAFDQAINAIRADPTTARRSLARYTPLTPDTFTAMQLAEFWTASELSLDIFRRYAAFLHEHGELDALPSLSNFLYEP